MNSPLVENAPHNGATSGFTNKQYRQTSPVMDDPSAELEKELAGAHLRN